MNTIRRIILFAGLAALLAGGLFFGLRTGAGNPEPTVAVPSTSTKSAALRGHASERTDEESEILGGARPLTRQDAGTIHKMSLTPEIARELLERAKAEITRIDELAMVSSAILSALCKQGHEAAAWDLVDQDPGTVRELGIGAIFMQSPEPVDLLLEKLASLTSPEERSQALHGLVFSHPMEFAGFDFSNISLDSSYEKDHLSGSILWAINHWEAPASKALLGKALDLVKDQKLDAGHLMKILGKDNASDAFYQWDIIGDLRDNIKPRDLEHVHATVVPNMIKADPDQAMKLITSSPSSKYSHTVIQKSIYAMYDMDPAYADAWVADHLPEVEGATGQRIIASVAQVAIRNDDFNTARHWADRLVNPAVRKQLLDQISAHETPENGRN